MKNKDSLSRSQPGIGRGQRPVSAKSFAAVHGLLVLFVVGAVSGSAGEEADIADRPNILLIVTDDQRWDAVGFAGKGPPRTPNLDGLAERGMTFTAAYCASMPCVPSRASMMTGLYHHRWRRGPRYGLGRGLSEKAWTWAHALRRAGYKTALFGKMHFSPRHADHGFDVMKTCDHPPLGKGWDDIAWHDDYDEWLKKQGLEELRVDNRDWKAGIRVDFTWPGKVQEHPISWVRDRAAEFLGEAVGREKPFAAVVSFRFPHTPLVPAKPYASMYDLSSVPIPQRGWGGMEKMPAPLRKFGDEGFRLPKAPEPAEKLLSQVAEDEDSIKKLFRKMGVAYWGLCTQLDEAIGKVLRRVDLRKTLVIVTSDHGVYFGRRRRLFKDPLIPFDAIARVPLVVAGPGVPEGERCENPVSLLDLAPTFMHAAEIDTAQKLDGVPLQRYFEAPRALPDRIVHCYGRDGFDMVRRGDVKYYLSHNGDAEMLFDLSTDPGEWKNLAGHEKWESTQAGLRKRLKDVRNKPHVTGK